MGNVSPAVPRVAVVVGSSRPSRICLEIAVWVRDQLNGPGPVDYSLIDLAEVDLPMLDEPWMASLGRYEHDHTRRWSALVASFDGFVFVAPQYNWGYPAVVKNAIDYLYAEWHDKPAAVVSYGARGGGKCVAQLRQVLSGVHMRLLDADVLAVITPDDVDDARALIDVASTLAPQREQVAALAATMEAVLVD